MHNVHDLFIIREDRQPRKFFTVRHKSVEIVRSRQVSILVLPSDTDGLIVQESRLEIAS
jgi:hypothetical protein